MRVPQDPTISGTQEATEPRLIILGTLQPIDEPLETRMLLRMHMHEDESETDGIGPTNFGHLDGERLIGGRKLDLKRKASTGGQRLFAYDMATLFRETGDHSTSGNVIAGKGQRNLNFITGSVAALHIHLCRIQSRPTWPP